MNGIDTTAENLKTAISGENYEFTQMYPGFIEQAKTENNSKAEVTFNWANKVEKVHYGLYQQALQALQSGKVQESKPIYICQRCGNTVEGEAPDKCPICGAPKAMFKKID